MKNAFKKVISALLVALVLVLSASILLACNPEKEERERQERERLLRAESVATVKDSFLSGLNEEWSANLDYSAISALDGAGEYVITAGWTQLVCDVLQDSSLQTGKLVTLADFMKSEDGQKLLADFSENAELIVSLLKEVDFTATDISDLVYDLLCAIVTEGGNIVDGIIADLNAVRMQPDVSADTVKKIGEYVVDMGVAKKNYVPTAEERTAMLSAFEDAKAPMSELISFVYGTSSAVGDDVFDALFSGDGALANISNGEIVTIVRTLRDNVTELKNALDKDAIANLNKAFDLIITKFDTSAVSSVIYAQIVQYAKYAYMFVDVIPTMCDVAFSAAEVFEDEEFIGQLRDCLKDDLNDGSKAMNISIIASKVLLKVTENFSQTQLIEVINDIREHSKGDYQKSAPLIAVDLNLNIAKILENAGDEHIKIEDLLLLAHPDIMDTDSLRLTISTARAVFDNSFEKFRIAYQNYLDDVETGNISQNNSFSKLQSAASFFDSFGIQNPFNGFSNTEAWGSYYLSYAPAAINKAVDGCMEKVADDINKFIEEFYENDSESRNAVLEMSEMSLVDENISEEEYNEFVKVLQKSRLLGIVVILMSR